MQEKGLNEPFDRICSDLHFLDKDTEDEKSMNAIPYHVKLEKFLHSVLIKDDLSVQIRAAFKAYIFLSYRKKDRQYAQKLMELIHDNDFCRDLAIWYDEFLILSENFNQSIENALQKAHCLLWQSLQTFWKMAIMSTLLNIPLPKQQKNLSFQLKLYRQTGSV